MPEVLDTYDYLIVGAGPAGCLLANRLSADPANRVLLLEAGGPDNYPWIHIPVGYLYCIGNPRTDWCFDTDEVPGLNGRSLKYPRGKVLGGCSSINGMIYMRGQARDYDQWVAEGNPGWSWRAAAAVPQDGGPFRRDQRNARRRRRMAGRTPAALLEAARCLPAGGGADRNRQRRGFQRWRQRRLRLLPGQPARRGALECLERLPARHRPARQPDGSDPCRSPAGAPRGRPRQGPVGPLAGPRAALRGAPRDRPERWRDRFAVPAATLRDRPAGPAGAARCRGRPRVARGRWQSPGSPAAAHDLQGRRRSHPQPDRRQPMGQAGHGPALPGEPQRAVVDGAEPTGRLRPLRSAAALGQPRIPRPAALAGSLRRAAACLPGVHRVGLRPASAQPGNGAHPLARPGRGAVDPAQLPERSARPQGRRRRHSPDPPHRRRAGAGRLPSAGVQARPGIPQRRGSAARRGGDRHHHLPPCRHLPHGAGGRQWWMRN